MTSYTFSMNQHFFLVQFAPAPLLLLTCDSDSTIIYTTR